MTEQEGCLEADFEGNVEALAEAIQACRLQCAGILCAQELGRPPRGLVLELGPDKAGRGVTIIGLNPGRATPDEATQLIPRTSLFMGWRAYWEGHLKATHPYFTRLRALVSHLGLGGPILWTNVAKCETQAELRGVPLQTLRTCAERYLKYELYTAPTEWPLIGVGRSAFTALAFMELSRPILGVPHPTGAYPQFRRLFAKDGRLENNVSQLAVDAMNPAAPKATWLLH